MKKIPEDIDAKIFFGEAIDAAVAGFLLLDTRYRLCFMNAWMEKYSGIDRATALDRPLTEVFAVGNPKNLIRAVDDALQRRLTSVLSHSIHGSLLPLFDDPRNPNRIAIEQSIVVKPLTLKTTRYCLVQVMDLTLAARRDQFLKKQSTDYRQLAHEYRSSEARARAILDNISEALLVIDHDAQITRVNSSAERLFGLSADVLSGLNCHGLFVGGLPVSLSGIAVVSTQELFGIGSGGQKFPAEISINTVEIEGDWNQILIVRDLTERKRIEETIHREKEFAQVTLQSITDAVLTTDAEGRVNFLNPAACNLLEVTVEEALGQPLLQLIDFDHPDANISAEQVLRATLRRGKRDKLAADAMLIVPNKGVIAVDTQLTPLRDLQGRIIGTVTVLQDVSQERRLQEQLTFQAIHDELTGLVNRREFQRRLEELLTRTRQDAIDSVLLFIDLDQFKIVNDTCGHKAGDELLRQISHVLQSYIRNTDTLARLGGDEFAILLPGCSQATGERISRQVLEAVQSCRFVWGGRTFVVGSSIGLVTIDSTNCNDPKGLLGAADAACYLAKDRGRNRVVVYQREGDTLEQQRGERAWASRIQEAVAEDRFSLFYQPILHCKRKLDLAPGCEILIRWTDDDGQPTLPMAFIPAAERYNLMTSIDGWVVRNVARMAEQNLDNLLEFDWIGINLSGHSVTNEAFLDYVIEQIEASRLPWSKICFEITETAAVSNLTKARQFLEPLGSRGCRFALDDFGSGFSSFPYLKNFPVNFVKIDGLFVKGMANDPVDAAVVKSICDLAHAMDLETIAESVEQYEWIEQLGATGIGYAQGYGISRPRPFAELAAQTPRAILGSILDSVNGTVPQPAMPLRIV